MTDWLIDLTGSIKATTLFNKYTPGSWLAMPWLPTSPEQSKVNTS